MDGSFELAFLVYLLDFCVRLRMYKSIKGHHLVGILPKLAPLCGINSFTFTNFLGLCGCIELWSSI